MTFSSKPELEWEIKWSRDDGNWKILDQYSVTEEDERTVKIIFLNQHTVKKLKLVTWTYDSDIIFPCVDFLIEACEASACPLNTFEYGDSCYSYFNGPVSGDILSLRKLCDNIVWVDKAYVASISNEEEDTLALNLVKG